jgi:beta-N-acetylhexosaminidase
MDAGVTNAERDEKAEMSVQLPAALRDRIGQMIMVGFRGITPREAQPTLRNIGEGSVGAVVLFDVDAETGGPRNIQSPEQLRELVAALKEVGRIPVLATVDAEGGFYHRLKERYGFAPATPAATMGERNDLEYTRSEARVTATELARVGIDMNLAPVVDLLNPANLTVSARRRSFSSDPDMVAAHARAFILGHKDVGVLTALKHFPGMGGVLKPYAPGVGELIQSWSTAELQPYRTLNDDGLIDAVLATRVTHPEIDERDPGCLSARTIDGLLRDDIGFQGVVLTDAMEMLPIWDVYGFERGILKAIEAGCDMLLFCNESGIVPYSDERAPAAVQVILDAIEREDVSEERINKSCARILALKERRRLQAAAAQAAQG